MYEVSAALSSLLLSDTRTFTARISVDGADPITEGIQSIKINGGSNGEDDFSLGSVFSQYVEITLSEPPYPLEGKEFTLYIGAEVNGSTEYIPMGVFTAGKPESNENSSTFTAYDRIQFLDRAFFSELANQVSTVDLLEEISQVTGVPIITTGMTGIYIARPEGYTCREVLAYISQLYGGFAVCDRAGRIRIGWYEDEGYSITADRYWNPITHNDFGMVVQKITFYIDEEDNFVSVGNGPREVAFSNPFMTQSILNEIWEDLENYSYMPGEVSFLGDPRLDPWDVITAEDLNGVTYTLPCMELIQEYDGGLKTTVKAIAKTEADQQTKYEGPSATKMKRLVTEMALINTALINKLDVESADIRYASITSLDAVEADVSTLSATVANIETLVTTDLSAATANITTLQAQYADISTLLSGNNLSGTIKTITLTADNTVISDAFIKSLVARSVTVYDLIAGRISTDRISIGSDDGGMLLSNNLIQMYDVNDHLRIQMGQDANGNFTFVLYDATGSGVLMDSTGIKASAISDGLIVNSMVANNAAIAGSKLDIDSVITAINGSTTNISASKIYFNEQAQSLMQIYSTMTENISAANTAASTAASTATQANANASNAVSAVSAVQTRMTTVESTVNGFATTIQDMDTEIQGISDGSLIFQTPYVISDDDVTFTARLYKAGALVTTDYDSAQFTWLKRTETRDEYLGYGYTMTVDKSDMGLGGVIIARFTTRTTGLLQDRNGNYITDRSSNRIDTYIEEI